MLDNLLERDRIVRVDFVKLDVDGHECAVLRGGLKMFKGNRPAIVLELSPHLLEEAGHSIDELLDILAEYGYRLYRLGMKRPLPMDPANLRRLIPKGGGINAIAVVGTR